MIDHAFGGDWTEAKLAALKKYLEAYRTIFTKGKASYYTTWYVDAFAGTGTRTPVEKSSGGASLLDDDSDAHHYLDGSARIALGLHDPFDHYLFIEKKKARSDELRAMIARDFSSISKRCEIRQADANRALSAWCAERNWRRERAVVFLDPYGLQVDWKTVEALAKTRAVDLWYLFPLNLNRLLRRDGEIEPSWRDRLDRLFGTSDWLPRFYERQMTTNLFGETEILVRDATVQNIQSFITERLKTCFAAVASGMVLYNSRSSPLFSLCFAAANEKGAPIALRIAKSILT